MLLCRLEAGFLFKSFTARLAEGEAEALFVPEDNCLACAPIRPSRARAVGPNDRRRGAHHRDLWIARPAIVPRRRVEVAVGSGMEKDLGKFCTACTQATVLDPIDLLPARGLWCHFAEN